MKIAAVSQDKMIGIVGGVGPYAGLDLKRKIFEQTIARTDQEHLNVVLVSFPQVIPDRTEFLLGRTPHNPAFPIIDVLMKMERIGVEIAGIPCNTSHCPEIFNKIEESLKKSGSKIELVHMIKECAAFIRHYFPSFYKVGILATKGTVHSDIYGTVLSASGIDCVYPDASVQELVHSAIYHREFGIKSKSSPTTLEAKKIITGATRTLIRKGADCVVLACTELPLAVNEHQLFGRPLVDSTLVLARAMIGRSAPTKLKDFEPDFQYEINRKSCGHLLSPDRGNTSTTNLADVSIPCLVTEKPR